MLTRSDLSSITKLNNIGEEDTDKPTPFNEPGWDEEESDCDNGTR